MAAKSDGAGSDRAKPGDLVERARLQARTLNGACELVEKYRLLEALARGEAGRTVERRDAMREIAARFPGALREWDDAPPEAISERLRAAEEALESLSVGGAEGLDQFFASQQTWIRWSIAVHERLRAALAVKRWLAGRAPTDALLDNAEGVLGVPRARVRAIASPPSGRVSELVYREVAAEAGVSVEALKASLFPRSEESEAAGAAEPEIARELRIEMTVDDEELADDLSGPSGPSGPSLAADPDHSTGPANSDPPDHSGDGED